MKALFKPFAIASIFVSQISSAALAGTTSAGGLFAPESQVYCGFNDGRGHELQILLTGDPSALGEYSAQVQEASLAGFHAPQVFENVSRMMPSESMLEFKGNGFKLSVDLTSATDIPNQFEGVLQAMGIAGHLPVSVGCTLN